MILNVAICDDSLQECESLKSVLKNIRPKYKIDIYHNGNELLHCKKKYDVIFLDIEMPEIDGMKLARKLRAEDRRDYIVFFTNYEEAMIEAFQVNAFRFLIKPVNESNMNEVINEIEKEISAKQQIVISNKGRKSIIYLNDVICIEGYGDGTYLYTIDGLYITDKTLKYWVNIVGENEFFQVHKSYIISFPFIKRIEDKEVELYYKKERVPISRRNSSEFRRRYNEYIKSNAHYI